MRRGNLFARKRSPVSFHSDLGSDENNEHEKYKSLMEEILTAYPGNVIVWHHLGLSKELKEIDPVQHIKTLTDFLDRYPNLYLDISWNVLYEDYFKKKEKRPYYVDFLNKYSTRILTGTDFVASVKKDEANYTLAVAENSYILRFLNDVAFRNIALGQNYFNILALPNEAPCVKKGYETPDPTAEVPL